MQDSKVNIIGTEYNIYFVDKFPEHLTEHEETATGLCNTYDKEIYIKNCTEIDCKEKGKKYLIKNLLMHELIHAFLYESGLGENTNHNYSAWSQNEEMVDWFAIQSPKIFKVFRELNLMEGV